MSNSNVSLAVLTWKSLKTMRSCLSSIEPLFDFFDERLNISHEAQLQEDDGGEFVVGEPTTK